MRITKKIVWGTLLGAFFLQTWAPAALAQEEGNPVENLEETTGQEPARTMGTVLHISPAELRDVQQILSDLGYEPGNVDGTWDEDTSSAIRDFQQASGVQPSGDLNYRTLMLLVRSSEEEAAGGTAALGQPGEGPAGEEQPEVVTQEGESPQEPPAGQPQEAGRPVEETEAQPPEDTLAQPTEEEAEATGEVEATGEEEPNPFVFQEPYGFQYRPGYVYQPGYVHRRGFPSGSSSGEPAEQYLGISPEWQAPEQAPRTSEQD